MQNIISGTAQETASKRHRFDPPKVKDGEMSLESGVLLASNTYDDMHDETVKSAMTMCSKGVSEVYDRVLNGIEKGEDWTLQNSDKDRSDPQTLEEELRRLQVLRSYLVLDCEREFPFERLTALASRMFKVPIALVSLIDLGRQWFMSNRGLGDVRETPRKHAFCAHAIISKHDLLIVPDAMKDSRFVNNPLVLGSPFIRFYAGAPLLAPEGYKLGTFCIIDRKTRPEGLSLDEKQNLRELAALAVQVLVSRRTKRERQSESNAQIVACTAHDLLTPLSGIELSLALLNEDRQFQNRLTAAQKEGIKNATTSSRFLQEICSTVRSAFSETSKSYNLSSIKPQLNSFNVDELIESLFLIVNAISKNVPVNITVDNDVPREIVSDKPRIFRCAMNYLAISCARTLEGIITMRFLVRKESTNEKPLLYVTCEDTASPVHLDVYEYLFKPVTKDLKLMPKSVKRRGDGCSGGIASLELALFSVACEMNAVGGEYGYRPRMAVDNSEITGCVFWFCIPFTVSDRKAPTPTPVGPKEKTSEAQAPQLTDAISKTSEVNAKLILQPGVNDDNIEEKRQKRALIIEDSGVVLKMLTKILEKLGFEVTQAENGFDGLKELKSSLYDLTLCDFLMPVMDGLDCVQQYREWERAHRPWISQRIVGISAHASQADVERGREVGMDDFRAKPVTVKDLSELITSPDQMTVSKRLDDIDRLPTMAGANFQDEKFQDVWKMNIPETNQPVDIPQNRTCTCLILTPESTASYLNRVHETIRGVGWQSTAVFNDTDAWGLLKMRTWDVILVDEIFARLIGRFREWESKHRPRRQKNVIVVCEKVSPGCSISEPPGTSRDTFDEAIRKPIGLHTLKILLFKKTSELP